MSGTEFITRAQLRRELGQPTGDEATPPRRHKYGTAPVEERTYYGIVFDSKGEMNRWCALIWEDLAGKISDLERQVEYRLEVNGVLIAKYRPDFRYRRDGALVVEDFKAKPTRTRAYLMKRRLMKALYGIDVLETEATR
jgi:Protein of unknown function (DUF1064)